MRRRKIRGWPPTKVRGFLWLSEQVKRAADHPSRVSSHPVREHKGVMGNVPCRSATGRVASGTLAMWLIIASSSKPNFASTGPDSWKKGSIARHRDPSGTELRKRLCMLQDAPCSTTCTMLSKAARAYAPVRGAEGSTDVPNWIGLGGKERCDVRSASRGLHAKSNVVPGGRHIGSHATRCSNRNRGGAG